MTEQTLWTEEEALLALRLYKEIRPAVLQKIKEGGILSLAMYLDISLSQSKIYNPQLKEIISQINRPTSDLVAAVMEFVYLDPDSGSSGTGSASSYFRNAWDTYSGISSAAGQDDENIDKEDGDNRPGWEAPADFLSKPIETGDSFTELYRTSRAGRKGLEAEPSTADQLQKKMKVQFENIMFLVGQISDVVLDKNKEKFIYARTNEILKIILEIQSDIKLFHHKEADGGQDSKSYINIVINHDSHTAPSWKSALSFIASQIYHYDPDGFNTFISRYPKYISNLRTRLTDPLKITNSDYYIEGSLDEEEIRSLCTDLLNGSAMVKSCTAGIYADGRKISYIDLMASQDSISSGQKSPAHRMIRQVPAASQAPAELTERLIRAVAKDRNLITPEKAEMLQMLNPAGIPMFLAEHEENWDDADFKRVYDKHRYDEWVDCLLKKGRKISLSGIIIGKYEDFRAIGFMLKKGDRSRMHRQIKGSSFRIGGHWRSNAYFYLNFEDFSKK